MQTVASVRAGWAEIFLPSRTDVTNRFEALDGLRGLAVLFVVMSHASGFVRDLEQRYFQGAGVYGVYLFFVLSAFLLTHQILIASPDRLRSTRMWVRYGVRRVARIFPAYAAVLSVHFALSESRSSFVIPMPAESFVQHLLLQHGSGVYWTIPVEFKYYVALPFVSLLFARVLRLKAAWVVTVGLFMTVGSAVFLWPGAGHFALNKLELVRYLPVFLASSLGAYLHYWIGTRPNLQTRSAKVAMEFVTLASIAAILVLVPAVWKELGYQRLPDDLLARHVWLFGLLWSLCLLGTMNGIGWFAAIFRTRLLRFIGVVSFSLYLCHVPILSFANRQLDFDPWTNLGVGVAMSIVVASFSYALIERPFLRWSARIGVEPRS